MSEGRDPLGEVRAILRPLTSALIELRAKRDRVGNLAGEAERLAKLAEGLIREAGLQHLLKSAVTVTHDKPTADRDKRAVEAFAQAHAGWVGIINGLESLARAQLAAANEPSAATAVERLALALDHFDQTSTATAIRQAIPKRVAEIAEEEQFFAAQQAELQRDLAAQEVARRRTEQERERKEQDRRSVRTQLALLSFFQYMSEADLWKTIDGCRSLLSQYRETAVEEIHGQMFNLYMATWDCISKRTPFDQYQNERERLSAMQQTLSRQSSPHDLDSFLYALKSWLMRR